ncbi:tetratricopeptide repeat protein [Neotabrizicola sp. sgz301269]|uniref:tetratricopeptide repeat protein n=1 Tax=Neotabrizicola sp. sgz301269 TaxID=3276282 RepID=UPI003770200F
MPSRLALCLALLLGSTALPALASTCANPDPALDLEQRVADCQADLGSVWDRAGYPHLVFNLGRSLRLLGRNDEALPVLQEALRYSPETAGYWAELARVYLALNEPATAAALYSQAITLDPSDPYNPADRAEAWFNFGKPEACVADLTPVLPQLRGQTDDGWFRNLYGRCLTALGRPAEALAAYDDALLAYPDYLDVKGNRIYALQALGRYDEVLVDTAALLDPAQTPDLTEAWEFPLRALRLEALGFAGRKTEIDADLQVLKARFPDSLDVVNIVAWSLFTAGRLDEADAAADTLRAQPEDPPLPGFMIDTIAQIDLAKGRTDQAIKGLELAAWRDPGIAAGWMPALAAQGYLPQTRLADAVLTAARRCIEEKGKDCALAPLPVTEKTAISVSRPGQVPSPAAVAPAEVPGFEPGPATPTVPPALPPDEAPGLGSPPKGVRPAGSPGLGTAPKPVAP